jgi:LacI family transcriptional regulator
MRPTMRDVARHAGVSLKTVSRVVNGEEGVRPDTAERVNIAITTLGFRRNDIARALRGGERTGTLGLVIKDVGNPFYSQIARGVEEVARAHDLFVISGCSDEDPARERHLIRSLCERRVDGLLVVPSPADHRYLIPEINMGTAAVFIDRPPEEALKADVVLIDNVGGARSAAEHLLAGGHRRIALVADLARMAPQRGRIDGFVAAMRAAGNTDWEPFVRTDIHDVRHAERAVRDLLALDPAPTAFFTTNNRLTTGALRAMRDLAEPPALVGFDDFDLADVLGTTVVAHDMTAIGREAARLAFERISGHTGPARTIVISTSIVARGSGERPPR